MTVSSIPAKDKKEVNKEHTASFVFNPNEWSEEIKAIQDIIDFFPSLLARDNPTKHDGLLKELLKVNIELSFKEDSDTIRGAFLHEEEKIILFPRGLLFSSMINPYEKTVEERITSVSFATYTVLYHEFGHAFDYFLNTPKYLLKKSLMLKAIIHNDFDLYRKISVSMEFSAEHYGYKLIGDEIPVIKRLILKEKNLYSEDYGNPLEFEKERFDSIVAFVKKRNTSFLNRSISQFRSFLRVLLSK